MLSLNTLDNIIAWGGGARLLRPILCQTDRGARAYPNLIKATRSCKNRLEIPHEKISAAAFLCLGPENQASGSGCIWKLGAQKPSQK